MGVQKSSHVIETVPAVDTNPPHELVHPDVGEGEGEWRGALVWISGVHDFGLVFRRA